MYTARAPVISSSVHGVSARFMFTTRGETDSALSTRTHYSLASRIMSTDPTYQAATTVAPIVEAHFARHIEEARRLGEDGLAPQPNARAVAAIINATFWASFRPEEGR